ncbi:MAG: hypothetical protein HC884_13490 [Chloroflexaceae bacterium]|nr:hypothetical protein [Chloroflexaceae bacterium]
MVMVVTDLHGDWDAYQRYRDTFVTLQAHGEADGLILTGDLIHRSSPPDHSLEMVMDVLSLQAQYGDTVIYLCGNHELPHIYHFVLISGHREFTSLFEAAMNQSGQRSAIVPLFYRLPFLIRTRAGVSLTHAGGARVMANERYAHTLYHWDHQHYLDWASAQLAREVDLDALRHAYARAYQMDSYDEMVRSYLAVSGPDDPRYDDLLRGDLVTDHPDFNLVWDLLFTRCEQTHELALYDGMVELMLHQLSAGFAPQQVLVAGHMNTPGGHRVVGSRHLRLSSAKNAQPREAGQYLLFDAAHPVRGIDDLRRGLRSVF